MKKTLLKIHKKTWTMFFAALSFIVITSFTQITNNDDGGDQKDIPGVTSLIKSTFAAVDAEADALITPNKIYLRSEALELKKNLEASLATNVTNLGVLYALVKFHSNAPAVSGGFKGEALRYAACIYRLNAYIGCLAYEHVYVCSYDLKNAGVWYRNSLACRTEEGTEWIEVKYPNRAPFGAGVMGNFSNNKILPLYENVWGVHRRRMMVPKCTGECLYTVTPDFLIGGKQVKGEPIFVNW